MVFSLDSVSFHEDMSCLGNLKSNLSHSFIHVKMGSDMGVVSLTSALMTKSDHFLVLSGCHCSGGIYSQDARLNDWRLTAIWNYTIHSPVNNWSPPGFTCLSIEGAKSSSLSQKCDVHFKMQLQDPYRYHVSKAMKHILESPGIRWQSNHWKIGFYFPWYIYTTPSYIPSTPPPPPPTLTYRVPHRVVIRVLDLRSRVAQFKPGPALVVVDSCGSTLRLSW